MRVMIVGSGGREHALAWKAAQSPLVNKVFAAPGNPGTAQIAENIRLDSDNIREVLDAALSYDVDLTVVGPEKPLSMGITDLFRQNGLRCFGPGRLAARVESSKAWSKRLMAGVGVPTAKHAEFSQPADALGFLQKAAYPQVVKADGLAAGKGVIVLTDFEQAKEVIRAMMVERAYGTAGDKIIVEEFLEGRELSVLAMCNGRSYCLLPSSRDHKSAFDGGKGPNTGGMGAYCQVDEFGSSLEGVVRDTIIEPVLWALQKNDSAYSGVLYCGLMLTQEGPKVLEFNARFGDPETQPIMAALDADIVELMLSCVEGDPGSFDPRASSYAACVVMASGGYPGAYTDGYAISGLDEAQSRPATLVFQAGTRKADGQLRTAGGRVLGVTATGDELSAAVDRAYSALECIGFENAHYRTDIGRSQS